MPTPKIAGDAGNGAFNCGGSLIPTTNEYFDLGSASMRWKDLYLSGSTVHLGNTELSVGAGGAFAVGALRTNSIGTSNGSVIDLNGTTISNVRLVGDGAGLSNLVGGGGGGGAATTCNVYFFARRGGSDFTLSANTVIGGWTSNLTTQTPANIFDLTTGVFTAPVTGTYTFTFGFRCGESGQLVMRVNNTIVQNYYVKYYGTAIHRLTAGDTLDLMVTEGSCQFFPANTDTRLWFQGALIYYG